MNNPVLEQSKLLGRDTMGQAGRPSQADVPNSGFDSRDRGQPPTMQEVAAELATNARPVNAIDTTHQSLMLMVMAGCPKLMTQQPSPADWQHRGGYAERLLGLVRDHLKAVVEQAEPSAHEKSTACIDALDDISGDLAGWCNGEAHRLSWWRRA